MTHSEQQKLFEALRTPLIHPDRQVQDQFDAITALDVYNAQPVIEEIERNAEARGRFGILLEMCWNNSQSERRK